MKERTLTTCNNCRTTYNKKQFRSIPYVGDTMFEDGEDPERIEYRNCGCGSTITIWTDLAGNPTPEDSRGVGYGDD